MQTTFLKKAAAVSGLFLALHSTPSFAGLTIFVNLVLQGAKSDVTTGESERFAEMVYQHTSKKYPTSNFITINAQTPQELRKELAFIVQPTSVVDALIVMSHGYSQIDRGMQNQKGETIETYNAVIDDSAGDITHFWIPITDPHYVQMAFEPIIGKFSPDSSIIFMACSLLEAGDFSQKRAVLEQVAKNFGQKRGSVYMNETVGQFYDKIVFQGVLAQDYSRNFWDHLKGQVVSFFMYPINLYIDRYVYNQGYRYEVFEDTDGEIEAKVSKDYLFNAMVGAPALGPLQDFRSAPSR